MGNFWDLNSGMLSPKAGIYGYDNTVSYKLNDIITLTVSGDVKFYRSLADNNTASLSDTTKWEELDIGGTPAWGNITGTLSNQTDLQNVLDGKAYLDSPAFTGTPTVPTPASAKDNSTKIPTTAWVRNHCATTAPTTTSTASKDAPVYIVENYRSGTNWYVKFSDGFIMQGGNFLSSNPNFTIVSLNKAFTTTNYNIQLTGYYIATASATPVVYNGTDVTYTKKTTMFSGFFAGGLYCDWYACGY